MTGDGDFRVRDLAEMTLKLRPDLAIAPRHDGDEPGYLIEDQVNGKYFRIGVPEYTFIALLNGTTTVREAVGIAACVEPDHALTEEQAATVCRWLVDNQLACTAESARPSGLEAHRARAEKSPDQSRWNPFFLRVSLFRPEGLLRLLLPWTGWLFSWPGTLAATLVAIVAVNQVLANWDRALASSRGIQFSERWLWLTIAWLIVKVIHELAHGIVCKRHGGSVRDAGVVLILGAPAAYMDVTSSWRFRSKWQRMHTASAGIFIELLIASLAAIVWSRIDPGALSDICFQVMLLASVGTLLFNANPLMRFDGYYVLSDLLEMPNLYGESQHYWQQLLRRLVLGVPSQAAWAPGRRCLLAGYGAAAFAWRIVVCCSIALAAVTAFQGVGLLLVIAALAFWLGPAARSALKYLVRGNSWEQPRRLRLVLVSGGAAILLVLALVALPWPCAYRAPAMVEFSPLAIVRADSDGFVREVQVAFGQTVQPGQILVVLENEQLRQEVAELQIRVQQATNQVRALRYESRTADSQAVHEQLASLEQQLGEKSAQLKTLTLRAPVAGTVVSHDLRSLPGTFLQRGAEVLVIGMEDRKELKVSIAQEDIDVFSEPQELPLWVRIHGASGFGATLNKVSPRARIEPSHEGFCVPFGGPLPVRVLTSMSSDEEHQRYELLAPRFDGSVNLTGEQSRSLYAGQRGFVALRANHRSIAEHLWARLRQVIQARTASVPQVL